MTDPVAIRLSPDREGNFDLAVPPAYADELRELLREHAIPHGNIIDLAVSEIDVIMLGIWAASRPGVIQGIAAVITAFASRQHVDVTVEIDGGAKASYSGRLLPPDQLEATIRAAADAVRPAIEGDDPDDGG